MPDIFRRHFEMHFIGGKFWCFDYWSLFLYGCNLQTITCSMDFHALPGHPWIWKTFNTGIASLQWRHNERNGVSNHRRLVCSTVCSGADQRKHQSSASLAFVMGIHRWPVDSPAQRASSAENVSIWWRQHVTPGSVHALWHLETHVSFDSSSNRRSHNGCKALFWWTL